MQRLILSDHGEEQLRRLRRERDQRHQAARLDYQRDVHLYDEQLTALATAYHGAFRGMRLFHGAAVWWRHRQLQKLGEPLPPIPEGPTVEELKWQAAAEGEQRLAAELTTALPGSAWTLIKGYQNRKGEIDYLLISPAGILALGCTHLPGTIICTEDRWIRQKYDPSGAPVTQVPILDRAGRSPSQQLKEPATHLQEVLSQKDAGCDITRAVLLTHPDVRLTTVRSSTVQILLLPTLQGFLWEMCRSASRSLRTERVIELVKEDHRYWEDQQGAERTKGNAGAAT